MQMWHSINQMIPFMWNGWQKTNKPRVFLDVPPLSTQLALL